MIKMSTSLVHSTTALVGPITSPSFATTGVTTVTADYTVAVASGVSVVECNNYVPITITLPTVASSNGRYISVVSANVGGVVIDGYATDLVCGLTQIVLLEKNESITLVCDGTQWLGLDCDKDRIHQWTNFCTLFRFSPNLTVTLQSPNTPSHMWFNHMKLPNQQASYKYRLVQPSDAPTLPTVCTGNACYMPDGQILFMTAVAGANCVYTLNPATMVLTTVALTGETTVANSWSGAVVMSNGNICMIPYKHTYVGILAPNGSGGWVYSRALPAHGHNVTGAYTAFCGGVFVTGVGVPSRVVMAPSGSGAVGLYTPSTGLYTDGASIGADSTTQRYSGAVVSPIIGCALFAPAVAAQMGQYSLNATTGTFALVGTSFSEGQSNPALALNGAVVCQDMTQNWLFRYDCFAQVLAGGDISTNESGSVSRLMTLPNGHVLIVSSNHWSVWDPEEQTMFVEGTGCSIAQNSPSDGSGCILPDGRCVFSNGTTIYIITTRLSFPTALCIHSLFNKF